MSTFSENLKTLMDAKGVSNYWISKQMSVSPTSVARWLEGNIPNAKTILQLADLFGCSTDYLLKGENNTQEKILTQTGIKSNGEVLPKKYLIAYVDILGSSSRIKEDNVGYAIMLNKVFCLISDAHLYAERKQSISIRYSTFTDNFIIGMEVEKGALCLVLKKFLEVIIYLQQNVLLETGLLLRGSVCFGDIIWSENVVSGVPIIKAHMLEESVSVYPRIIVEESVLKESSIVGNSTFLPVVTEDVDGMYYVSWFITPNENKRNNEIRKKILEYDEDIKKTNDIKAIQKSGWLWRSFNKAWRQYEKDLFSEDFKKMNQGNNFFNQNGDNNVCFGDNSTINTGNKKEDEIYHVFWDMFSTLDPKDKMDIMEEIFHRRKK